jgi:hypothetical protein
LILREVFVSNDSGMADLFGFNDNFLAELYISYMDNTEVVKISNGYLSDNLEEINLDKNISLEVFYDIQDAEYYVKVDDESSELIHKVFTDSSVDLNLNNDVLRIYLSDILLTENTGQVGGIFEYSLEGYAPWEVYVNNSSDNLIFDFNNQMNWERMNRGSSIIVDGINNYKSKDLELFLIDVTTSSESDLFFAEFELRESLNGSIIDAEYELQSGDSINNEFEDYFDEDIIIEIIGIDSYSSPFVVVSR